MKVDINLVYDTVDVLLLIPRLNRMSAYVVGRAIVRTHAYDEINGMLDHDPRNFTRRLIKYEVDVVLCDDAVCWVGRLRVVEDLRRQLSGHMMLEAGA